MLLLQEFEKQIEKPYVSVQCSRRTNLMGLLVKLIFNKTDQHGPRINSAPTYNRHFCIYVQNWYVYKSVNLSTVVIVFFIQNQHFSTIK